MQEEVSWAAAAISIAGIGFFFGLIMLFIWQVAATWRGRMLIAREEAYRKLAEQATEAESRTAAAMEKAAAELVQIRGETAEMRRLLSEVE